MSTQSAGSTGNHVSMKAVRERTFSEKALIPTLRGLRGSVFPKRHGERQAWLQKSKLKTHSVTSYTQWRSEGDGGKLFLVET